MSKTNSIIMATRLKQLREEQKLSHVSLSAVLKQKYGIDISRDSLMSYEVSDENHSKAYKNEGMRVEYLRCLSEFYNVSSDYILGLTNDPARYATAVDDLHLSPDSVGNLIAFSSNEDICYALNLILESPTLRRILNKLKSIPKSISAEIDYVKRLKNAYIENIDESEKKVYISDLGMLGQFMANDIATRDLTNEIISLHPEMKDRIEVLYGSDAIEKRIDDLGNDFAFLLKMETGYFELERIRADHELARGKRLLTK